MCGMKCVVCFFFYLLVDMSCGQRILGVYSMDDHSYTGDGGSLVLNSNSNTLIRLIGMGLNNTTKLFLTQHTSDCIGGPSSRVSHVSTVDAYGGVVLLSLQSFYGDGKLYMCVKNGNDTATDYVHQGTDDWLSFYVLDSGGSGGYFMPLWFQISVCSVLLILSGLFSGLNLGLLSLDQTELKIISKVGSEKERNWAKRIAPLRKRGNFLLCTMLLGNVIVNSTFTILFDNMTDGLIAVIGSTIGIVVLGEIVPQAICSRHGLAVGANTYWVTILFMILTFPASFPISLILDKILGEEIGQVYNKEKLQELIRMTADSRVLQDNEANIMAGALQLTNKCVKDIMTKASDVFMLGINRVLDFETMSQIMHHGFTRVPVYDGENTVSYLLNTKDLALIDPDDNIPVSTVCKFYDHRPLYVDHDFKLDVMLQEFLKLDSHMAIVQQLHNTGDLDPYFETIGIVTLEDVLEEILQREIVDEKDIITENRLKLPRSRPDFELLGAEGQRSRLPKQLAFVAFQFLSTSVEPFSETCLAKHVLVNLMKKDIVINLAPTDPVTQKNYIYQKGVPTDRFVLILQGAVEVIAGEENMVFESGPFSYFGVDALDLVQRQSSLNVIKARDYVPDFSARAVTDVQYLCINRELYLVALRTTKMLRTTGSTDVKETFDAEMEKLARLNSHCSSGFGSPTQITLRKSLTYVGAEKKGSTFSLDHSVFCQLKVDSPKTMSRNCRSVSEFHKEILDSSGINTFLTINPTKYSEDKEMKAISTRPPTESRNNHIYSSSPIIISDPNKSHEHMQSSWKVGADSDEDTSSTPLGSQHLHNNSSDVHSFVIMETNCDAETRVLEKIPLIALKPSPVQEARAFQAAESTLNQLNIDQYDDRVPLISQTWHDAPT